MFADEHTIRKMAAQQGGNPTADYLAKMRANKDMRRKMFQQGRPGGGDSRTNPPPSITAAAGRGRPTGGNQRTVPPPSITASAEPAPAGRPPLIVDPSDPGIPPQIPMSVAPTGGAPIMGGPAPVVDPVSYADEPKLAAIAELLRARQASGNPMAIMPRRFIQG